MHDVENPTLDRPTSAVSRRTALGRLAASAGSLTILGTLSPAWAQEKGGPKSQAATLDASTTELKEWQKCRGKLFLFSGSVQTDGETSESVVELLKLIDVQAVGTDDPNRPVLPRSQAISLLFRSSEATPIPTASYQLDHPSTDVQELLISQVRDDRYPDANLYEAILN